MNEIFESFGIFYETRVLNYINTLLAYPIKIVILLIDISIVVFLVYKVIKIMRGTRAIQLIKGVAVLIVATAISEFLSFKILHYILSSVMTYGVLVAIVVFQPELRKALEQMGNANFKRFLELSDEEFCVPDVVAAVKEMSKKKIGALIAIERETNLGDLANTGVILDSKISEALLINIFTPDTPLHDGAVIIKENKLYAASCILPITDKEDLERQYGTRHRAAIGVTEQTDAIVIVVSEETGTISLVINGKIIRDIGEEQLAKELKRRLAKPKRIISIKDGVKK